MMFLNQNMPPLFFLVRIHVLLCDANDLDTDFGTNAIKKEKRQYFHSNGKTRTVGSYIKNKIVTFEQKRNLFL